MINSWDNIPQSIRNEKVRKYYEVLKDKRISLFFKRVFDFLLSLILIIIFIPLLVFISIVIKIDSDGPVIFKQIRITQYGKRFIIFKFRTMCHNAEKKGAKVTTEKDNRITNIGEKLRKYRLDELPQLFNILVGDMTFVGVRPEVPQYVEKYTDEMKATLLLPAGVTSSASIEFKDEASIIAKGIRKGANIDDIYISEVLPQKMKINLFEIENFSFFRDLKIMLKTVVAVLK